MKRTWSFLTLPIDKRSPKTRSEIFTPWSIARFNYGAAKWRKTKQEREEENTFSSRGQQKKSQLPRSNLSKARFSEKKLFFLSRRIRNSSRRRKIISHLQPRRKKRKKFFEKKIRLLLGGVTRGRRPPRQKKNLFLFWVCVGMTMEEAKSNPPRPVLDSPPPPPLL